MFKLQFILIFLAGAAGCSMAPFVKPAEAVSASAEERDSKAGLPPEPAVEIKRIAPVKSLPPPPRQPSASGVSGASVSETLGELDFAAVVQSEKPADIKPEENSITAISAAENQVDSLATLLVGNTSVDSLIRLDSESRSNEKVLPDTAIENPVPPVPEVPVIHRETIVPGTIGVAGKTVRIALSRNAKSVVVYSVGDVEVRAGASAAPGLVCRGRIELSAQGMPPGKISVQSAKFGRAPASLPCTLLARGKNNFFEYNEKSYRGSFAAVTDGLNGFTLVNIIDVEDYLRGVVALEIGKLGNAEVEAVKAQAVAARTYTYRRIQQKTQSPFDLLPDVSDQVYGGVNAEHPVCDKAVETTKDIILVYKGSICMTYYHSTCGGRTANVEDVWSKSGDPYLRSISDTGPNGSAWCRISKAYSWQCSWTKERLGKICAAFGKKTFPSLSAPNGNPVKEISVQKRYGCGRVESCIIRTDNGTYEYGSDRIRFVLRQDRRGDPILPSANFTVEKTNGDTLKLNGHGNGHGVGMCQMGAIGRARAGQSYEQILKAYYRGAELRRVRP